MKPVTILTVITFLGSMFCWWALAQNPGIVLPWWLGLAFLFARFAFVALGTGLAATLFGPVWPYFFAGSVVGTLAGLCTGTLIWPNPDGIANAWLGFLIAPIVVVTALLSAAAALAGSIMPVTNPYSRGAIWVALIGYCALGPAAILLTPSLAASLVVHNDRIAKARFDALRVAVARTAAEDTDFLQTCDASALSLRYSGPQFSPYDWDHIAGKDGVLPRGITEEEGYNYVVACYENGAYTIIAARPITPKGPGALSLCADQTGKPRCGLEMDKFQRPVCKPCAG